MARVFIICLTSFRSLLPQHYWRKEIEKHGGTVNNSVIGTYSLFLCSHEVLNYSLQCYYWQCL